MRFRPVHDRMVVPEKATPANERVRPFSLPIEIVEDPSLNTEEKRSILAEWASDSSAVESCPALRRLPGTSFPVTFASIMDARAKLDELVACGSLEETEEQLGRVVVASFARSRRNDGVPQ